MREALNDGFCISSAAKMLHPVLTFVKRAEDRGCAGKTPLCQFQKELDICFEQFRHALFVKVVVSKTIIVLDTLFH